MINKLAAHVNVPDGCKLTVEDLLADGFNSSPPWFFLLVAEVDAELVGYALYNRAYSSWTRGAFYLEDLYVSPEHRHSGAGYKLFRELCRVGVETAAQRLDGHVWLEGNEPALLFYARLGVRVKRVYQGRASLRLDRPHMERIARSHLTPTSRL